MTHKEIHELLKNSDLPAPGQKGFEARVAIKSVGKRLKRVEALIRKDDGRRWPVSRNESPTTPVVKSKPGDGKWEEDGALADEQAFQESALSSFATLPYAPFDLLLDNEDDNLVQPAIAHPNEWVRFPLPEYDDGEEPCGCKRCSFRYGIRIEHRRDSSHLWLRWDGEILPAPPDMRKTTVNMREAEKLLLSLRNEIHRVGNEVYAWSRTVCDWLYLLLHGGEVTVGGLQRILLDHYHGLVVPAFMQLSCHIDRFNFLRKALLRRLVSECFPGENTRSYIEKAQAEDRLPNSERSGLYWWKLSKITMPWAVIAHPFIPKRVIYREASGRANLGRTSGVVGRLSKAY